MCGTAAAARTDGIGVGLVRNARVMRIGGCGKALCPSPSQITFRERVLSDDEFRTVRQAAGTPGGILGAMVKSLILTG